MVHCQQPVTEVRIAYFINRFKWIEKCISAIYSFFSLLFESFLQKTWVLCWRSCLKPMWLEMCTRNWWRQLLMEILKKLKRFSKEWTPTSTEFLLGIRKSFLFLECGNFIQFHWCFFSFVSHSSLTSMFLYRRALQAASQNGHLEVIKVLLRYKADVEIEVSVHSSITLASLLANRYFVLFGFTRWRER